VAVDRDDPAPSRLAGLLAAPAALAHGLPWEIWTVPVGGGAPRQLTRLGEDMPCPSWSPDGTRLLVQREVGLYLVDAASGTTQQLGDPPGYGCADWQAGA
jgi:hypothetical protein